MLELGLFCPIYAYMSINFLIMEIVIAMNIE